MPFSYYSGEVELPALEMVITDAQGNAIRTIEARTNITFEFQRSDGRVIKVKDTAVFGQVTQPLFAVGKLYKVGWGIEPQDACSAFLTKLVKQKNGNNMLMEHRRECVGNVMQASDKAISSVAQSL